jgi:hypothetical protein
VLGKIAVDLRVAVAVHGELRSSDERSRGKGTDSPFPQGLPPTLFKSDTGLKPSCLPLADGRVLVLLAAPCWPRAAVHASGVRGTADAERADALRANAEGRRNGMKRGTASGSSGVPGPFLLCCSYLRLLGARKRQRLLRLPFDHTHQAARSPQFPARRYPSPATRYPLPATRYPLPATRYPLPATRSPPRAPEFHRSTSAEPAVSSSPSGVPAPGPPR